MEMASRGGTGIEIDLGKVPQRETGMTPYEIMLSESQERMLLVAQKGREDEVFRVFQKWGLDAVQIGRVTNDGKMRVRQHGKVVAEIPNHALTDDAPVYKRPLERWEPPVPREIPRHIKLGETADLAGSLKRLLASPNICGKRWIWQQYDHMVMADTVQRPGGDAAVVRVHGTKKGLAISCDVTPRYCAADPREGAKQAVAECWRNLTAAGADPLAITDCMNFGSPERPEIMGEFVGAVEGMAEACTALAFPVVSGNVSLYNETNGVAIPPTPAIGGIGLIPDIAEMATIGLKRQGDVLMLLGAEAGHLGQSLYMQIMLDRSEGAPPPVDLDAERRAGDLVRGLIRSRCVSAVHDVSDGGLLVAIAEMALAGARGVDLEQPPAPLPPHALWFGEDQARYVVAASPDQADAIHKAAAVAKVPLRLLGRVGGDAIKLEGEAPLPLAALVIAHEDWLPRFMVHG
jgi:phosphoribosylformylglycinamidine synthase